MKNNPTLQSMLLHLAEDAAKADEIDLWPALQVHLAAEKNLSQQRNPEMNAHFTHTRRYRTLAAALITLLMALAALFGLPQGRVWAQNMLEFFTRYANQIALPTPLPVNLSGVTPGVSRPTLAPTEAWHSAFYETCGELPAPRCSFDQIRKMVAFPVKTFAILPEGLQFKGASGGLDGVTLVYRLTGTYGVILFEQAPKTDAPNQSIPVGSSAIVEQVQIGAAPGEYVKGTYSSYGGDSVANWDANADTQLLRWEENGLLYTLMAYELAGNASNSLDKTGLVSLASALTDEMPEPENTATPQYQKSLAEAEAQAGFNVFEPEWLPDGYHFESATYLADQKRVCLQYSHPSDISIGNPDNPPAPSLSITESILAPLPKAEELVVSGLKPGQVLLEKDTLAVGGAMENSGLYIYGSIDPAKLCGRGNQHQVLEIQTRGINITILAQEAGPFSSTRKWLTKQEMVRLAESLTGVHTLTEGQLDLDRLPSIEDARRLASFTLKFPTQLPEGMNFSYARLKNGGDEQLVVLIYSDGAQEIEVMQTRGSRESLQSISGDQPQMYRQVSVHQQAGLLSQGYWDQDGWREIPNGGDGGASVTWFEEGIQYTVSGFNAYSGAVWLEIAESLK